MSKRRISLYAVAIALLSGLYFFENNTGTRIVLFSAVLLPLFPGMRAALFASRNTKQPKNTKQRVEAFPTREAEESGDYRQYVPGDPVNRIHWKLSAKRDELLIRPQDKEETPGQTLIRKEKTSDKTAFQRFRKPGILLGIAIILLSVLALVLIPQAKDAWKGLLNRIYAASEAVNAYAYEYFSVPDKQPLWPAALLLCSIAASLVALTLIAGSRLMALLLLSVCVGVQVYFGLSLPVWASVLLFALYALWLSRRPFRSGAALRIILLILLVALGVTLLWPGVDFRTEQASEKTRDLMSRFAQNLSGAVQEAPEEETKVRHVHTRSLFYGENAAQTEKEYRLETVEEEQVSKPSRIDYLRIALLLGLTTALLILPFAPFLWLNARRKKALDARKAFEAKDTKAAICAIFQHVIAWLEAAGYGAGNRPYRDWAELLAARLPEEYVRRFADCAALFEEAAYSDHTLGEEQRQQALELLQKTEQVMQEKADLKQKLSLRYKECLWV